MFTPAGQPFIHGVEVTQPRQSKTPDRSGEKQNTFNQALESAETANYRRSKKAEPATDSGKDLPESKLEPSQEIAQEDSQAGVLGEGENVPLSGAEPLVLGMTQNNTFSHKLSNPAQQRPLARVAPSSLSQAPILTNSDQPLTQSFLSEGLEESPVFQTSLSKTVGKTFEFNNRVPLFDSQVNPNLTLGANSGQPSIPQLVNAPTEVGASSLPPVSLPLPLSPTDQNWGKAISQRVLLAVRSNLQQAEIQISPANLGPIELQIKIHQDSTSVHFVSAYPLVRDSLNDAIPKLQEMLEEQGLTLADAQVHDQAPESRSDSQKDGGWQNTNQESVGVDDPSVTPRLRVSTLYQVDEFA